MSKIFFFYFLTSVYWLPCI